jgi:hypothetical protein
VIKTTGNITKESSMKTRNRVSGHCSWWMVINSVDVLKMMSFKVLELSIWHVRIVMSTEYGFRICLKDEMMSYTHPFLLLLLYKNSQLSLSFWAVNQWAGSFLGLWKVTGTFLIDICLFSLFI